jgi:hypothetical protein
MPMKPMVIEGTMCVRTLRLKVKAESYPWLNAAAMEVNQVWNWGNATSAKAARPFACAAKWLTRASRPAEAFSSSASDTQRERAAAAGPSREPQAWTCSM